MDFDIIIPWRDNGCPYQLRNFKYCYKYYSSLSIPIIGKSDRESFNRSQARNDGVSKSKKSNLIIIDSDNVVNLHLITKGLKLLNEGMIIKPFTSIHYLNEKATLNFINGINPLTINDYDTTYLLPNQLDVRNSGGIYIIKKDTWEDLKGMSESFEGWGLEDTEFNLRFEKKYRPITFLKGNNYHLYHPQTRIPSKNNIELLNRARGEL
jgi:predicted glycosyltransferase involved in capsule biosynthesis